MIENNNCKHNGQLYDPDIVSVVTIVLGTLGAIGGIVTTLDYIERKRNSNDERKYKEERRVYIEIQIVNSFRDLSFSINKIRRRLEFLDSICRGSLEIDDRFSERKFNFGNCPILLTDFQFRLYQKEQGYIFNEVGEIHKSISIIEELIAENQYLFDNKRYINNLNLRHTLSKTIMSVNDLMQEFGRITIDEFLERTISLCRKIEKISNFKDEFMN